MSKTRLERIAFWLSAIPFFGLFLAIETLMAIYRSGTPHPNPGSTISVWVPRLPPEWYGNLYVAPQMARDYKLYIAVFLIGLVPWTLVRLASRRTAPKPDASTVKSQTTFGVFGMILTYVGLCTMVSAFGLMLWIQANGSLTPDFASGRTFAVQDHGNIYIWPLQGELFYALLPGGFGLAFVGFWMRKRGERE